HCHAPTLALPPFPTRRSSDLLHAGQRDGDAAGGKCSGRSAVAGPPHRNPGRKSPAQTAAQSLLADENPVRTLQRIKFQQKRSLSKKAPFCYALKSLR